MYKTLSTFLRKGLKLELAQPMTKYYGNANMVQAL